MFGRGLALHLRGDSDGSSRAATATMFARLLVAAASLDQRQRCSMAEAVGLPVMTVAGEEEA
jgi:hypothetical protein